MPFRSNVRSRFSSPKPSTFGLRPVAMRRRSASTASPRRAAGGRASPPPSTRVAFASKRMPTPSSCSRSARMPVTSASTFGAGGGRPGRGLPSRPGVCRAGTARTRRRRRRRRRGSRAPRSRSSRRGSSSAGRSRGLDRRNDRHRARGDEERVVRQLLLSDDDEAGLLDAPRPRTSLAPCFSTHSAWLVSSFPAMKSRQPKRAARSTSVTALSAPGEARAVHDLERAQQRLRRDAGPVGALAADELVLDDGDLGLRVELRQRREERLARRALRTTTRLGTSAPGRTGRRPRRSRCRAAGRLPRSFRLRRGHRRRRR